MLLLIHHQLIRMENLAIQFLPRLFGNGEEHRLRHLRAILYVGSFWLFHEQAIPGIKNAEAKLN